jgi:exodeoxyribonuclease I
MMIQPQTYLFYDLETSGLNPAFDQILQFAAIRTDAGFQEISRHDFRIQLRPDIIPAPGALLTTDISVLTTLATGICEYDAVREIHTLFNEPNTINVGYNSLSFDDAFLRFTFYRNLLPPYTHQFKDGCKRLDIFPITVLYWLQASPLLNWTTINGKRHCQNSSKQLACQPAASASANNWRENTNNAS